MTEPPTIPVDDVIKALLKRIDALTAIERILRSQLRREVLQAEKAEVDAV